MVAKKKSPELVVDHNLSSKQLYIENNIKKETYAIRKASDIQWKKVDKSIIKTSTTKSIGEEYLNHHLRQKFPSFLKRSSNKSKGQITYSCKLSN